MQGTGELSTSAPEALKAEISTLLTDSRELMFPAESMFFALRTASADGHDFIPELYARGVRHFVVDKDYRPASDLPGACLFRADSPAKAMQTLAKAVRDEHPGLLVIGITGSRGKTIVKEMLHAMLQHAAPSVRSPRSYNSQIGVPLSIWEIGHDTRIGIFEAGISRPGEMDALQTMIRPRIGIFTSLTAEHRENFASAAEQAREKARLFREAETVIYPEGDDIVLEALRQECPQATLIPAASNAEAATLAARLALKLLGIDKEPGAVPAPISTRMEVREALKGCQLIVDAFTHDLRSTADALCFMRKRATDARTLTVVLQWPVPAPAAQDAAAQTARMLRAMGVSRLIVIGTPSEAEAQKLKEAVKTFEQATDAVDFMRRYSISDFSDELILLKGTRESAFDDILCHLEAPRHETVLEVDLNALVHNYNYFKSLLPRHTGIIAMVKADAYGLGAVQVSRTLQAQGAAMLAVAVVDEGVALRQAGITMPIIVMNPMGTNYKALFDYRLEPSVFSARELETLLRYADIYQVEGYPVHIKLDTGMHRVGFLASELPALAATLNAQSRLRAASVFTHLATADCLDMDSYTEGQLRDYDHGAALLQSLLPYPVKRHALNTAGIVRYIAFPSDLARLGIGLYGISPLPPEVPLPLQNVASLLTTIISLRHWPEGTAIGYGRRGVTSRPAVVATIPIGYADGLNRHLGRGRATFIVRGKPCPTIGNICMDQCMIDVTDAGAAIGDTVTIFGPDAPVQQLAETLDTIPYEVLTSISPRVKRIYFRD